MSAVLAAAAGSALAAACATVDAPTSAALVVRDGHTAEVLWRGSASYTVRGARAGVSERAAALPGLGELQVGVGDDDGACRLVWSRGGLGRLVLYAPEQAPCATRTGGRVCVQAVRFRAAAPGGAPGDPPPSLVIDGCVDANDLLWGKVEGTASATVGPRPWRERCVPVPVSPGCAVTYLAREDVRVETNPVAIDSLIFRFDDERWHACFLEADSGAYALAIRVEDGCGRAGVARLAGHSGDLDD